VIATITNGTEYEISYRVKWLAGDNQVNTRLYFNRLPKTTIIDAPRLGGTPGAVNSRHQMNIGPTYTEFGHTPAVPPASAPVTVSVVATDPDNVASMTLWYSVNGGTWQSAAMTLGGNGKYAAMIPGQAAGAVVQFYAEGTDGLGAISTYPAAGRNSRALYQVADGRARLGGPSDVHNVRLVMTPADANLLHLNTNAMSNERIGATIVYDERTVYYDVGVRLKGSERGRRQDVRISFDVEFQPDRLFRGIHENIAIDRSGAGDQFSQKEIIVKHITNQAGEIPGSYDDLIHTITPRNIHTGSAMLMMARHSDEFLDTQFDQGGDGTVYEYELIYYPAGTVDGNPESLKLPYPSPDGVVGIPITNLGDDKERYRHPFLIKNNRDRDDYSRIIAMAKVFALSGAAYNSQIDSVIDVDQWLRSLAAAALTGIGDSYLTGGLGHNARLFADPEDGRVLLFPHDMDFAFSSPANGGVVLNADLPKMLGIPVNVHRYYGHIHDIVTTTFNSAYMTPWINHYDSLLPAESFASFIGYIGTRATTALNAVNTAIPTVAFNITTNIGNDFSVSDVVATLEGTGWVNVRAIRIAGDPQPLAVTWTTPSAWRVTVPVDFGPTAITLEAVDFQGNVIATDSITVTSTVSGRPLQDFLRVAEVMYHPADPSPQEISQGYGDSDEFEYLELVNTSAATTLDLTGVRIVSGIEFDFATAPIAERTLAPLERLVVVENLDAFRARYGSGPRVAGQYTGRLDNGGETIALQDADAATIQAFTYDDIGVDWHPSTDGLGSSLVIVDASGPTTHWNDGPRWRPSVEINGSPGGEDVLVGDINRDNQVGALDLAILQANLGTVAGGNPSDLTQDGLVNRADVARFVVGLGRSYPPPAAPSAPAAAVVSRSHEAEPSDRVRMVAGRSRPAPARAQATDAAVEALTADGDHSVKPFRATRARRSA
jgi:hypothetical protein